MSVQEPDVRLEHDALGTVEVPARRCWGAQTQRSLMNFAIGTERMPEEIIRAFALLKKAAALDIAVICPLHGPVLRENLGYYLEKYNTWSSYEPEEKGIVIAYASIHGNTAKAARKLASMLEERTDLPVKVYDLARADMPTVVAEAFRYDRLVLAAASYDGGVFPCMEDFLHHLKAKTYRNRKAGLLENGTWAPSAARTMRGILEEMKGITLCEKVVSIRSTLKESDEAELAALAEELLSE